MPALPYFEFILPHPRRTYKRVMHSIVGFRAGICYTLSMPNSENQKKTEKQTYPEHLIILPGQNAVLHARTEVWVIVLVVFAAVAFAGARWYGARERERAISETLALVEQEQLRQSEFVSGIIKAIGPDAITLSVSEAGVRDVRVLTPRGVKYYIWSRDDTPKKVEVGRSEIAVGSFVTIESNQPVGEKTQINAKTITRVY